MFKNIKLLRKLKHESTQIDYEFENINSSSEAVIYANIKNTNEIVSSFSCGEDLLLTQEFESYIENMTMHVETQNPILLKINTEVEISNEEKCEIKQAIRNHYTKKIATENENLKRNSIDSIFLTIGAIVVLALLLFLNLNGYLKILTEIFDILAWVLLWEVFDNFIFQRRNIRKKAIDNYKILNMRIEFN